MKQRNLVKINTYLLYWWSPDQYADILQGTYICMRSELKTGENESMQETKMTCLWTGSLQLIKGIMAHEATKKQLAHT